MQYFGGSFYNFSRKYVIGISILCRSYLQLSPEFFSKKCHYFTEFRGSVMLQYNMNELQYN